MSPVGAALNVGLCICTCQMDEKKLLNMMTFCLASACDSLNSNQLVRYFMPPSLSRMSFNVEPLYTGLISALSSLAGSGTINLTLPFTFGTSKKLLHHSVVLSMPRGTVSCYL